MVGSLLAWILDGVQRALDDLHRSGSAAASGQTEETGGSDYNADQHDVGVADELANVINIDLARQASAWFDELENFKAEAENVRRQYTASPAKGKLAPLPLLLDRLDLLLRWGARSVYILLRHVSIGVALAILDEDGCRKRSRLFFRVRGRVVRSLWDR